MVFTNSKIDNTDYYTTEWWRCKMKIPTIQETSAILYRLSKQGKVEKVFSMRGFIRWFPTDNYSVNSIITNL